MNIVEQYLFQALKASINSECDDMDKRSLNSGRMHVNVKIICDINTITKC